MHKSLLSLAVLVLMLNGCSEVGTKAAQPGELVKLDLTGGLSEEALHAYVGQRVEVKGVWNGAGKESGFVDGGKGSRYGIYVKGVGEAGVAKQEQFENGARDGTRVRMTGVLRFYDAPAASRDDLMQRPSSHFYFDAEEAEVRFEK